MNRAGRWSAAARQAYLIRSPLTQPFFSDRVIRAAHAVPLRPRINDQLHRDVLASLRPELLGLPLAGRPWQGEPRAADNVLTARPGAAAERALQPPQADPHAAWALASLAALLSGDWLHARPPAQIAQQSHRG